MVIKYNNMIGALVGAGLGLAKSIFGGIKSAKSRRKQDRLLKEQQAKNDALFNKQYYQDYMGRSDVQAAMNRVRDTMKRSNERAAAMSAVTGATPEAELAQKEASAKVVSDTASAIQANADANKDAAMARYQAQDNAITNAKIGQNQQAEAGMSNFADQALAGGSAIATTALQGKPVQFSQDAIKGFGKSEAEKAIKKMNTNYTSVWDR